MDPAFEGVGQEPGLLIWRIENFEVKPYDEAQYGKFYEGDCFIVLNTKLQGSSLVHDVHFWLGSQSSQDEYGTAALKAVDLDETLGGKPVQHREVQEHESKLFVSYFRKGVQYLKGGVSSGFRHVDPDDYEPALFQVKGRRNVRVKQVDVAASSLTQDDCYVLDTVDTVYVFTGRQSRHVERLKAIQVATGVRDNDHAGSAQVHILDENAESALYEAFFEVLGGGSCDDVAAAGAGDDAGHEVVEQKAVTMYKVTDGGDDSIEVEEVGATPLSQDVLVSEDCFILNTGGSGLYVWIGRESSRAERQAAMKRAEAFLKQHELPAWTKVERVVQEAEPVVFKQYFSDWKDEDVQAGLGQVYNVGQIAEALPGVDLQSRSAGEQRHLVRVSAGAALGFLPDDGSGSKEIFRIEEMELAPVAEETYGMFFGGDSYVIKYTYEKDGRENYIVYFWLGKESSQDEQAAAAINAVRMDDQLCGKAVQVRVTQGHEPRHFLTMFQGRMIVYSGGHASGFRNVHDHDTYDADGTRLFHVRGLSETDCRAVQVPEEAAYLSPDDVFVLETPAQTYIWHGQASCTEEKAVAGRVASLVSPDREPLLVEQGEEPEEFWTALGGGSGDDVSQKKTSGSPLLHKSLMHCRINEDDGRFFCDRVEEFDQEDLNADDVMILDTGDELYCWIGDDASQMEKEKSFAVAERLLKSGGGQRGGGTIIRVKQGHEPASFKALFSKWDDELFNEKRPSYDDVKSLVAQFNQSK